MTTIIDTDSGAVEIRAMNEDYIVGDDEAVRKLQIDINCRHGRAKWPNPTYVEYFKKLMKSYGSSAILAWQDKTLVGFLPFFPLNCGIPQLPHCIQANIDNRIHEIRESEPTPFADLETKALKVQCLAVSHSLRRQGIGTAMAAYLIDWADEHGWERIQGWAFEHADEDDAYRWLPSISFWEKSGFTRGESCVFDPSDPATDKPGFNFFYEF